MDCGVPVSKSFDDYARMHDQREREIEIAQRAYVELQRHNRRGLRWLLCVVGLHNYKPVAQLRPWTETNALAACSEECVRCGKVETNL